MDVIELGLGVDASGALTGYDKATKAGDVYATKAEASASRAERSLAPVSGMLSRIEQDYLEIGAAAAKYNADMAAANPGGAYGQQAAQLDHLRASMDHVRQSAAQTQAATMASAITQADPVQQASLGMTKFDRAVVENTEHVAEHEFSVRRGIRTLEGLGVAALGANHHFATLGVMLAEWGVGGPITLAVVGGIAAMAYAYEKLSESSRKAAEDQKAAATAADALIHRNPLGDLPAQLQAVDEMLEKAHARVDNLSFTAIANPGSSTLAAANTELTKELMRRDAILAEMHRLDAAMKLAQSEPIAQGQDDINKQRALNEAFGQSELAIGKLNLAKDLEATIRRNNTGLNLAENAAMNDEAKKMAELRVRALELADARKSLEEQTARNVAKMGSDASDNARVAAARDEYRAIGEIGTALEHNRVEQEYLTQAAAANLQYRQAMANAEILTDGTRKKAAEDAAAATLRHALTADRTEADWKNLIVDGNAALDHRRALMADATANNAAIRSAQEQLDLVNLTGVAAEHLRDAQEASNAILAAEATYRASIAGASAEDVAFARQRLDATIQTTNEIRAIKDATVDAAAAAAPWHAALTSLSDDVATFASDLFSKPRDAFQSFVDSARQMFGHLVSDLTKMELEKNVLPSISNALGIGANATSGGAAAAIGLPGWGLAVAGLVTAGTLLFGAGNAQAEAAKQMQAAAQAQFYVGVHGFATDPYKSDVGRSLDTATNTRIQLLSDKEKAGPLTQGDLHAAWAAFDANVKKISDDFFGTITQGLNALNGPAGAYANQLITIDQTYEDQKASLQALIDQEHAQGDSITRTNELTAEATRIGELHQKAIDAANAAEKARVQAIDDGLSIRMLATKGDDDATKALQRQIDERKEMAQAIQDGWTDEQKKLLVQVEASEDAATAAATLAQHLKDTADAAEALTRSTESLMTRFYRAVNDASAADTYAQQASHRQELSGITDPYTLYLTKYVQAAEDAQLKATQEAKAQTDALTAQTGILQDSLNVQQQQLTALQQVATSLATYASGLNTSSLSPLSPTDLLEATKATRDSLYQRAMAGDQTAASQYGGADTAFLTQDRSYNASNSTYANDFKESQRRADELAALYGTKATAEQQMVQLLTDQLATAKQQLEAIGQVNTSVTQIPPPLTKDEYDAIANKAFEDYNATIANIRTPIDLIFQGLGLGSPFGPKTGDQTASPQPVTVDLSPVTTASDRTTTAVQEAGAAIVGTSDEVGAAIVAAITALTARVDALAEAMNTPDTRSRAE